MRAGPRADVAEALDDELGGGGGEAERRSCLAEHVDAAAAGSCLAAEGSFEGEGLTGDDRRRVAVELAVLVHHPGHDLGVRVDVRGRDVAGGAEDLLDLVHEGAGDLLELCLGELGRVAIDAALGAAERDVRDGGLPGHERGEGADLVDVYLGVVADAALVGPASAVVLDAVAGEDVDLSVLALDGDLDGDLPVGGPEDDADVVGKLQVVGCLVEVVADDVEVRDLGFLGRLRSVVLALGLGRHRRMVGVLILAVFLRRVFLRRGLGVRHLLTPKARVRFGMLSQTRLPE